MVRAAVKGSRLRYGKWLETTAGHSRHDGAAPA
jgi:hypothetical protein